MNLEAYSELRGREVSSSSGDPNADELRRRHDSQLNRGHPKEHMPMKVIGSRSTAASAALIAPPSFRGGIGKIRQAKMVVARKN